MVVLFHSHLARLRMNSESNSESRLKTTEKKPLDILLLSLLRGMLITHGLAV
jgi:hypothetical protein